MATKPGIRRSQPSSKPTAEEKALLQAEAEFLRQKAALTEIEVFHAERRRLEALGSSDVARKYTFIGEVNIRTVTQAILTLEQWVREDPTKEITIELNTPGGALSDGFALYDRIRAIVDGGTPVRTHATGSSLSMGALLLQAGSHRTASKNAYLMLHVPQGGTAGSTFELQDEAALMDKMTKRCAAIIVDRSNITARRLATNWDRRNWWLDADEALKEGLIDEVTDE